MAFSKYIKLPTVVTYRRPSDLVYAANEEPPPVALTGLVLQHAMTALTLIAYVLVIAQMGGLDQAATQHMVSASILGMAVATIIQSWGGPLGSGLLLVSIPNPAVVATAGLIAAHYGAGGFVLASILHGIVAFFAGELMPRLRSILTPTVAGVVICVAGLSLIKPGLVQATAIGLSDHIDPLDVIIASSTLGIIVALSVWGAGRGKIYALLAGLVLGVLLAALLGRVDSWATFNQTPFFGLPHLPAIVLDMDIGVLLAIVLLSLMTQLDTFGSAVLMHKMNDPDWRRPDMSLAAGAMRANAIGDIVSGCFSAPPTATSSANIALCHISRSTSRIIGVFTGLVLLVCAFMPKVALALTLIPTPVIGAVGLYAAAYLIVSGLELITSRALDARGLFMVGLAFVMGVGVIVMPELVEASPASLHFIAGNAVVVAGSTAIVLNLIFRLGISQRAALTLEHHTSVPLPHQIINFVESQGAHWNARREVIHRAASAALEAAEALQNSEQPCLLVEIRANFDEYNLNIELVYQGEPWSLNKQSRVAPKNLLDLDDEDYAAAVNESLKGLSQVLLHHLAERVSSGRSNEYSYLRLHFDH